MPADPVAADPGGGASSPPPHPAVSADSGLARGVQAGFVAYLLWGLLTLYWKALDGFDAVELISWRVASAVVVMAALVTIRRSWRPVIGLLRSPKTLPFVGAAALLLTVNWLCYVYAVVNEHVLETALGYFMAPLGTMALGVFVLGEVASRLQYLAMALAAVAVVVLSVSYGDIPFAAIAIAVSWSLYGLTKRRLPVAAIDSFAAESFLLAPVAVVAVLVMAPNADSIPRLADGGDLVLVALSGLVTAIPLVLFAFAATRVPFTVLGPIQYLVPTINLVLGWLVYDEAMPPARLAGFACVWVALVVVTTDQLRRRSRQRQLRAMVPA